MSDLLPLAKELNEYTVTPGVLGFVVFAALGAGVWMLLKSMSKHLGRIDFTREQDRARDRTVETAQTGERAQEDGEDKKEGEDDTVTTVPGQNGGAAGERPSPAP